MFEHVIDVKSVVIKWLSLLKMFEDAIDVEGCIMIVVIVQSMSNM